MVSLTIPVSKELKSKLKEFSWVNWSEVGRFEARKKEIFERFIKNREISDADNIFCESIDWHPVDELPLKEEFIKELKKAEKEPTFKLKSISDIFEDE
jgi:hypothetical protein